jgi:hypothetical protein
MYTDILISGAADKKLRFSLIHRVTAVRVTTKIQAGQLFPELDFPAKHLEGCASLQLSVQWIQKALLGGNPAVA